MIALQNCKRIGLIQETATAATTSAVTGYIDTRGYDYALLSFQHPVAAATNSSAKFSAFALSHSDSTSSTGTAITGLTGTTNTAATTSAFVLAAHNDTANPGGILVGADMRGRGRYLYYTITPGASNTTISGTAILGRAGQSPNTDTERGGGAGYA